MYPKGKRICPCCGKPLELIAPTKELLPDRVGVSANFVEYYFPSNKRYLSITSRPHSCYRQTSTNKLTYSGNLNKNFVKHDRADWHIIPIYNTSKKIKRGGLWIFSQGTVFFCKNCEQKLSLNRNPLTLFSTAIEWFAVAFMFALFLIILTVLPFAALAVLGAILSLLLLEAAADLFFTARFLSNFVPTDEFDSLIFPEAHLALSTAKNSPYLRAGNVFMSGLDGEKFFLYLTEKGKQELKLHICGLEGEPERLLSLIREKQSRGKTVTLPLTFEGKAVGNAEVLETYDPPEPAEQADEDAEYVTVWQCRHCGYDNPVGAAECKSCGKWKE